jgi:hypothetical protein
LSDVRKPPVIRRRSIITVARQTKRCFGKTDAAPELSREEKAGAELMELVGSVVPENLPEEIRQEVQAAIIIDLLNKSVKPEQLKVARFVRRYVSAAYGLQNRYRFTSLDAPVGDGETTLGELIAA